MSEKIIIFNRFEIKAKYLDVDIPFWDKNGLPHYKFRVWVKNLETDKKIAFDFFDSFKNYQDGKKELTKEDLVECFKMLLDEATFYLEHQDIDEFHKEFGGDSISDTIRAYKGCKKQYEKFVKLGLTDSNIFDFLNNILQKENENKLLDLIS